MIRNVIITELFSCKRNACNEETNKKITAQFQCERCEALMIATPVRGDAVSVVFSYDCFRRRTLGI